MCDKFALPGCTTALSSKMRDDPASHYMAFSMLCDSLSNSKSGNCTGTLAMKADTGKSLQEQYGERLCCDTSLQISIRTNPLYEIDIHDTESPGLVTGTVVPTVPSISKHHVLDSPRKSLSFSPVRGFLSQKKENTDPKRISYAIDSKFMTERKYEGAAHYWQERAKYGEIIARLASWDLAQERRHSEGRLAEERRKSARAMEEVTNAIIDRNAAKAEAARQIMQRCALLARLSEVEAASSGSTPFVRYDGAANEGSSPDANKIALTSTTPDVEAAKGMEASSWDVFTSWNIWSGIIIFISLASLAWTTR